MYLFCGNVEKVSQPVRQHVEGTQEISKITKKLFFHNYVCERETHCTDSLYKVRDISRVHVNF